MIALLLPAIENLEGLATAMIRTYPDFKAASLEKLSKICSQLFRMESDSRDFKQIF
jgi:hypothetical protein